jgi:hypothetical protein
MGISCRQAARFALFFALDGMPPSGFAQWASSYRQNVCGQFLQGL